MDDLVGPAGLRVWLGKEVESCRVELEAEEEPGPVARGGAGVRDTGFEPLSWYTCSAFCGRELVQIVHSIL